MTVMMPLTPAAVRFTTEGDTVSVPGLPSCVSVTTCPSMVIVTLRDALFGLAAAV